MWPRPNAPCDAGCKVATDAALSHLFAGGAGSGGAGEIDVYDVIGDVCYDHPPGHHDTSTTSAAEQARRLLKWRGRASRSDALRGDVAVKRPSRLREDARVVVKRSQRGHARRGQTLSAMTRASPPSAISDFVRTRASRLPFMTPRRRAVSTVARTTPPAAHRAVAAQAAAREARDALVAALPEAHRWLLLGGGGGGHGGGGGAHQRPRVDGQRAPIPSGEKVYETCTDKCVM